MLKTVATAPGTRGMANKATGKVTQVIGTLGASTARSKKTRLAVGVGDRIVCSVKKALPNSDLKSGDKVQAVIVFRNINSID